jgi:outer membrane protein assembly factor BamB
MHPGAARPEAGVIGATLVAFCALAGCGRFDPPAAEEIAAPAHADIGVASTSSAGWPTLFGPTHDSISAEAGLALPWPAGGPRELWRRAIGTGYSSPVVADDSLVLFHRVGDEELIEGLDPATGESRWTYRYPTSYVCRYQYSSGPYSTPVIDSGRVYTWGAEGEFHCLDLADGALFWHRSLSREYAVAPGLFPVASSPLVLEDRIVLNVGGQAMGAGIVVLDKATGATLWTATDRGASCATPRAATIHGQRHVFVLTAESLVSLDPADGRVRWDVPFQSRTVDSINATSPLVHGDLMLVTHGPGIGALCLRVLPDGSCEEIWRDRRALDSTWSNLVCVDGFVYGFTSRRLGTELRCVELATGRVAWSCESPVDRGASLAAAGHLILWGERGGLAAVAIDSGEPRLACEVPAPLLPIPCYAAPALDRCRLYLRGEGVLACYDLQAP